MKRLLAAVLSFLLITGTVAGCGVKDTSGSEKSTSEASFTAKYADNEFYEKSVKQLKDNIGLSDGEADDAFGVLLDCGLVDKEISNVFKNTSEENSYNIWINLVQYTVNFKDNKIVKISDGFSTVIYENRKKVETTAAAETTVSKVDEKPTEKQKETVAVTPIDVVAYTDVVEAGANAHVEIKGEPNTKYTIDVVYSSGSSKAEGLEAKTSDANGNASWDWEVGSKTAPGEYNIHISGAGTFKDLKFTVK